MICGILALYGGSSMLQKYSIRGDFHAIVPYEGIFFPNILLFRAFQEVNSYESMSKLFHKVIFFTNSSEVCTKFIIISERGIKWSNLFSVGDPSYKTAGSMGMMIIFSIIGTIFHFLMSVYIHAVRPGKYGVKKHPFYFLQVNFFVSLICLPVL